MNFEKAREILISAAKAAELTEYEIYYIQSESVAAETLKDEISSFSSSVEGGISFRCISNGKMGYASSELFEKEEMEALVKRAISNAENMDGDDVPEIFRGSESYPKPTHKAPADISAATLKEVALELQKKTYGESEYVADGTQSGAFVSKMDVALSNSYGLELRNTLGTCGSYVQAVINRNGEAESEFKLCEGFEGEKYDSMSKRAVEGALEKLGATEVDSGKYDIVFSAKEMKSMLSTFSSVFSGKMAHEGLSLLAGKVGEKIAADCITIVDDPMREGSSMQTSFDGEGVATYRKNVIENGVLKTLLYDLATAKKVGVVSTGNGHRGSYTSPVSIAPYNFYIKGGEKTREELMAGVEKGIYITELKGLHAGANAVTGDFSIESAGFLIENGKLGRAVKSFTVAGNFFEMLRSIEDISSNVDFSFGSLTSFGSPDALVRNMSVAGK
ncbi:MAG: TldD/PmbA family protein [Clostridia bacterium]|nr:TldD/PmbA family protein [Clostridia bacterium]